MIWNKSRECMSRDELAVLQGKRLVELVKYMYQSAGYYRKKMQKLGLEPGDIRGIEDLDKLPFTTRADLAEAYPMGVFAVPGRKIVRYRASDHNAGMETFAGYTQNDIDICGECMARSISMADLGEKDVIQVAYSYGLCADGLGAHCGAEKVGAAVVPMPDDTAPALAAVMRRLHVTGMIGAPSDLMRVAQMVEKQKIKKGLRLKSAICGGEPCAEDLHRRIQERLGIRVHDIFGLNELTGLGVACECECQNGMHIQEDFFLAEILDTNTLLVLPGGIRGELVFTTLQKEGIPLIRYRTMNITTIHYEKCGCGRTMARMDRICGRTDDIVVIRGNSVFAVRIEAALSDLQDIDASYIVCIRREHNLDVVDVYIEGGRTDGALLPDCGEGAKSRVADAVCSVIGMMPNVHFAENGTLEALAGSCARRKVTIVDQRGYVA